MLGQGHQNCVNQLIENRFCVVLISQNVNEEGNVASSEMHNAYSVHVCDGKFTQNLLVGSEAVLPNLYESPCNTCMCAFIEKEMRRPRLLPPLPRRLAHKHQQSAMLQGNPTCQRFLRESQHRLLPQAAVLWLG